MSVYVCVCACVHALVHLMVIQASLCVYLDCEANPSSLRVTQLCRWPEDEFVICLVVTENFLFSNCGSSDLKQTISVSTPPAYFLSVCQFLLL